MSYLIPNHKNTQNRKNINKAQQQIRYYQPLERLDRRFKFHKLIQERFRQQPQVWKKDNFLLFDAIVKRGGYKEVCSNNRWEQINMSMQYQKKLWGISKYYQQVLLAHEEWLRAQMKCYQNTIEHQFVEMYLLAPNNLTAVYYQLTPAEYMFAQSNFFSIDEYYNLKSLALFHNQIPPLSMEYADKYMMLRRRLLFTQQVRPSSINQLNYFGINSTDSKVIIIGCSLASLIIADTLSEFGIHIIIIDKQKNQLKYTSKRQIVDYGLTILEGHKGQGSYYSYLNNLQISVQQFSGICGLLDQEGKLTSEQRVRISEQHFISIIEEMKAEVMSKKKLYEQMVSRVVRRKWEHEKSLMRWHYDRYILFNRLKGENTTVADIATYQNKKFVKHLAQPYAIVSLRNINKLYQKIKNKKNVEIVGENIEHISYSDGNWNVGLKNDSYSSKYLIYSDQESICKSVLEGTPRLIDIGSDIMGQNSAVLQYLSVLKYIYCHYVFKDKLVLKDNLKGMNCFTLNSIYGYIYFFILPSSNELLGVLRCYHHTSINYFAQLLIIFQNRCMAKSNKMVGEQSWNFDYSFSLKDQKYIQMLIRIKQNQKMYIMLPITSTHCSQPLQTEIDIITHISNLILDQIYPNYTYYLPSVKTHFKQNTTFRQPNQNSQRLLDLPIQSNNILIHYGGTSAQLINSNEMQQQLPEQKVTEKGKKQSQASQEMWKLQKRQLAIEECNHIFGLDHEFIKNYASQLQLTPKDKRQTMEGHRWQQIQLRQNLWLYSLGQPYIKKKDWFNQSLGIETTEFQYPLDRMVTRRQFFSLKNSFKTTTYYQIVLVVKDKLYYCFAEESQPKTIYFHTDLTLLLNMLNQTLCKLREEQIQEDASRRNRSINPTKIVPNPPKCLSPAVVAQMIQEQVLSYSHQYTLEQLLNKKLSKTLTSSYQQRFMTAAHQVQHVSPAPFSDSILVNQLLDINSRVSMIINELVSFRDKLCVMAQLKIFSLFELFFGVLNQQYICCEIMNKFGSKPYQYQEIQHQDSQLCQQIKQVFSKSVMNQQYSIFIVPQPGCVAINRNFMNRKYQNDFEPYCYLRNIQGQSITHFLIIGQHKINFNDKEEIINYILKSLVINHHNFLIVKQFQEMIRRDIKRQLMLGPKLKLYYLMTKKQIKKPISGSTAGVFYQKCKDLNNGEKQQLGKLMVKEKVKWIDNDFVYVIK